MKTTNIPGKGNSQIFCPYLKSYMRLACVFNSNGTPDLLARFIFKRQHRNVNNPPSKHK